MKIELVRRYPDDVGRHVSSSIGTTSLAVNSELFAWESHLQNAIKIVFINIFQLLMINYNLKSSCPPALATSMPFRILFKSCRTEGKQLLTLCRRIKTFCPYERCKPAVSSSSAARLSHLLAPNNCFLLNIWRDHWNGSLCCHCIRRKCTCNHCRPLE